MRLYALSLAVGVIATGLPQTAVAETISDEGVIYSYVTESAPADLVYSTDYGTGSVYYGPEETVVYESETMIVPADDSAYVLIEDAPLVYEDSSAFTYESGEAVMMSEQAGYPEPVLYIEDSGVTETLDAPIYDGTQVITTY